MNLCMHSKQSLHHPLTGTRRFTGTARVPETAIAPPLSVTLFHTAVFVSLLMSAESDITYTKALACFWKQPGTKIDNSYGFCDPWPSAPPLPLFLHLNVSVGAEDLRV